MSGRKEKGVSAFCRKRLFFTIIYAEVFHSHLLMNTEKPDICQITYFSHTILPGNMPFSSRGQRRPAPRPTEIMVTIQHESTARITFYVYVQM